MTDLPWSHIVVPATTSGGPPRYDRLTALPFGATGAVVGFNRLSRALRAVIARYLAVTVTTLYDDVPLLCPEHKEAEEDEKRIEEEARRKAEGRRTRGDTKEKSERRTRRIIWRTIRRHLRART